MDNENAKKKYTEGSLAERYDSWIKQVLKYLVMTEVRSYVRKRRAEPELPIDAVLEIGEMDSGISAAEDGIIVGSTQVVIRNESLARALKGLSARDQEVIENLFFLELPVRAAARKMQVKPGTLSGYRCSALKSLKKAVLEDEA